MNVIGRNTISGRHVYLFAFLSFICLFFVLLVNGAIPLLMIPTLGQSVWTTGFSSSFLNDSVFSIYAKNIGAPAPAAIAFGLAGAWPCAVFIKFGLHPADAYTLMVAMWLTVSFFACYCLARSYSVSRFQSLLASVTWGVMPMIVQHAGYSMLSTGIALLPLYFLATSYLFDRKPFGRIQLAKFFAGAFGYFVVCLVAVFMDGYSFMMFAVGSTLFGIVCFIRSDLKKVLFFYAFPVHMISFGLAYLLYAVYIGKPQFDAAPLDFFRGWGTDLTFWLIPTKGITWLADLFHLSVARSANTWFGDSSVWRTTFALPLMLAAVTAVMLAKKHRAAILGFAVVGLFGYYMSLGPSFKINSTKPGGQNPGQMMEERYAVTSTGSGVFSENLPGFKNMRASYRWGALGALGAWMVIVLALSRENPRYTRTITTVAMAAVTLLNIPDLSRKIPSYQRMREAFLRLDHDLLSDMSLTVKPGEMLAFLPWRNDFLVNYLAPNLHITTWNIGGDKNLNEARKHWPETMRSFPMGRINEGFDGRLLQLLARNEADAVVLPYIDMLWAAHRWPSTPEYRDELLPVEQQLDESGFVDIIKREYYSIVRLKSQYVPLAEEGTLETVLGRTLLLPPDGLQRQRFTASTSTRTGMQKNGELLTTGKNGFLLFGPYVRMKAGRYRLHISGFGKAGPSAWADVVSDYGKSVHARFSLVPNKRGTVVEGDVVLKEDVENIEVRVYVGEDDRLTLTGYQLVPLLTE